MPGKMVIVGAGIAGLLAGASSMALGEWLSVQSSRELYQNQIAIEAEEIEHAVERDVRLVVDVRPDGDRDHHHDERGDRVQAAAAALRGRRVRGGFAHPITRESP